MTLVCWMNQLEVYLNRYVWSSQGRAKDRRRQVADGRSKPTGQTRHPSGDSCSYLVLQYAPFTHFLITNAEMLE